jgi:glutamate-1-semialdehyde aminotransferase
MVPCVDMVRYTCSGTEATMHVIRLAREFTGREKIIKFDGHFHGFHDYVMWNYGGGSAGGAVEDTSESKTPSAGRKASTRSSPLGGRGNP